MTTESLTECQRRVFDRLVKGDSNLEIANALEIGEKTVKAHITAILKAFNCTTRCKLIVRHYTEQASEQSAEQPA